MLMLNGFVLLPLIKVVYIFIIMNCHFDVAETTVIHYECWVLHDIME